MFDLELQRRIREKKTPLALTLAPEAEKLNGKFVKNFIDMFGDTPMAQAEALRYHGTTLLDAIEALYREFGYYRNALCSFAFEGESGMHTMQELMKKLRANAPEDIAGYKVESVVDYDTDGTGLPRANVLEYHLDGGHKLMVRPSGTEPKIKVYLSAVGDSEAAADAVNAALAKAAADMMKA